MVAAELLALRDRFPHTPFVILSPLAEGADRLVARLAIEHLHAKLIVPLPMDAGDYRTDFATPESRNEFDTLLDAADAVSIVGLPHPAVPEQRDFAYARTGAYVAENAQILIALWDGEPSRGVGGTADVVAWELAGGAPDAFRQPAAAANVLNPLETGCVIHIHPDTRSVAHLPPGRLDDPLAVFARIDEFNRDARRLIDTRPDSIAQSRRWLLGDPSEHPPIALDPALAEIAELHAVADALSQRHKRVHSAIFNVIYALFVAAVLMFGLIDWWPTLIWLYVLIFPLVYLLTRIARRGRWEQRSLDDRALAEGLRVLAFWRLAGVGARVSDAYLSKHGEALSWIRQAIANVELRLADPMTGAATRSVDGIALAQSLWIESQLSFFASRRRKIAGVSRRFSLLSTVSFTLTFLVAVAYALSLLSISHGRPAATTWAKILGASPAATADDLSNLAGNVFQGLMGFLGALGVASEAIRGKKDFDGQERRYALVETIFTRAKARLADPTCEPRAVLEAAGREALQENGEWLWTHLELGQSMMK